MSEQEKIAQQAEEVPENAEPAMQENAEPATQEKAEQKEQGKKASEHRGKPSLSDRLYKQIEIMEREQEKIATGYEGSGNPRAARTEYLAFAKQITETANAIINIKRGGK